VNSQACRDALRELRPKVVVVYGTRIIRRPTLQCTPAPFILPRQRQPKVSRPERCLLGAQQRRCRPCRHHRASRRRGGRHRRHPLPGPRRVRPDDNISTYQHRQIAVALPLLIRAIEDALAGRLEPHQVDLPSRQWFHPTLWAYFKTGLKQGVW
jgi:hypothetical protein